MTREVLFLALNETTHALRFSAAAAKHFSADTEALEKGSERAAAVAYIVNRLSDAHAALSAAEEEIARLIGGNFSDETLPLQR